MARQVRGWDAVRAWRFIRACKAYCSAYAKRLPQPDLPEQGPFPVRLQPAADAGAMRFGMAAWEGPRSSDPPVGYRRRACVGFGCNGPPFRAIPPGRGGRERKSVRPPRLQPNRQDVGVVILLVPY